jgi:gamma-glutamylaminecyclotransferase
MKVFVFGTLKQGFPNFGVNKGVRVPGTFRTRERFPLFLVGERHVPWMLDERGQGEQVIGEVYEVDDPALAAMDRLERVGEPDGYRRVPIWLEGGGTSIEAFAYLKFAPHLVRSEARLGPIDEYTMDHARLYRSRAMSVPVRGMIFGLFHTLTARESEWSTIPATCDRLRACFDNIPAANVAMLRRLRKAGLKLALLSNADLLEIAAFRGSALAGLFDVEVFSCDAGCAKPEAAIYHACLDALRLAASDCVFVGDGGSDELAGAKAVGLRTVFVSGVIAELWPECIPARLAAADHHVEHAWEVERIVAPVVAEPVC